MKYYYIIFQPVKYKLEKPENILAGGCLELLNCEITKCTQKPVTKLWFLNVTKVFSSSMYTFKLVNQITSVFSHVSFIFLGLLS